ncbi:unnamed protein product [Arctogadus glacialis]
MDRKVHRMEFNNVLSETTVLDPRFKRLAFNDNQAVDEALKRGTAAAARCTPSSQPAQPPGNQERDEVARGPEVEPQTSAVWRLFDARATENIARRNPPADVMLEVESYLEEALIQRTADPLSWRESKASTYQRLRRLEELISAFREEAAKVKSALVGTTQLGRHKASKRSTQDLCGRSDGNVKITSANSQSLRGRALSLGSLSDHPVQQDNLIGQLDTEASRTLV